MMGDFGDTDGDLSAVPVEIEWFLEERFKKNKTTAKPNKEPSKDGNSGPKKITAK